MGKRPLHTLIIFFAAAALLLLSGCGLGVVASDSQPQLDENPSPELAAPVQESASPQAQSSDDAQPSDNAQYVEFSPSEQTTGAEDEPEPEPEQVPEDAYTGPDLAQREQVDDEFFADAAFFGNSLVDGLGHFGGLEYGDFYAATSASVVNVGLTQNSQLSNGNSATLLDALTEHSYGKIYILLGINEIGFEPDYFAQLYNAVLDTIAQAEPDADIYIMSLSPVTEERSDSGELFSMERIELYNQTLYRIAEEREYYYVDLCQALADEDGYLDSDCSTDGIHLKTGEYPRWADYLRTHYAGDCEE
jgi:lysophospholipase L1-like esterase